MNTDRSVDLKGSQNSPLPFKEETKAIIGCAFEVLNTIGHGLHEKVYENALTVAFRRRGVPFEQQRRFPVVFLGETVGEFIPDLVVFDAVISEPKVIDQITEPRAGSTVELPKDYKEKSRSDS